MPDGNPDGRFIITRAPIGQKWMTTMLHATGDPFDARLQLAQLDWVANTTSGATGLAENYTGPPSSRSSGSESWLRAAATLRSG